MVLGLHSGLLLGASGGGGSNNTVLLVHFDGADGATEATDESASGHSLSFHGNAQIDTAQSVFGGASLFLPDNTSFVSIPNSEDFHFGSDPWTIKYRIRPGVDANIDQAIIGLWDPSTNQRSWIIHWNTAAATPRMRLSVSTDGTATSQPLNDSEALNIGTWAAHCIEYDGTDLRFYKDGGFQGAAPITVALNLFASNARLTIGAADDGTWPFTTCHIDELQITKGEALHASDSGYTVETEPFAS